MEGGAAVSPADELTPEQELEHWHAELARVLKANPALPWTSLIEWAEEAEHWALKAATRSGRANLASLGKQLDDAQKQIKTLTSDLEQARQAKLSEAEPKLAAMERLAAAWQKEADRARKDLADQAYPDDTVEFVVWSALAGPLSEGDIRAVIKTIRQCRHLAAEALNVCADTWDDAKKRITDLHQPVRHLGKVWCSGCSVRRSTGPQTDEWVAFIPHPCPTLDAINGTPEVQQ
jgi:hypothetical protein